MTIRISVVVSTCKQPQLLDRCMHALVAQNFPRLQYEIIVADDADDPETKRQVMNWSRRTGGRVEILYAPVWDRHGAGATRNVGWRLAAAKVIAFIDDDAIARRDWLMRGLAAMRGDVAAVAGRVHVPMPDPRASDYEFDTNLIDAGGLITANCFVRRDALVAIGGFDERFTVAWRADSDLFLTLVEAHGKVVSAPGAVVLRPAGRTGWGASLAQQRKILLDALLYKKHAALYRGRIHRAPCRDCYAIVAAMLVAIGGFAVGSSTLALVAAFVWLAAMARFCWRRLRGTSHAPRHILEMMRASMLIPPLAVFWGLVGAVRFRAFIF